MLQCLVVLQPAAIQVVIAPQFRRRLAAGPYFLSLFPAPKLLNHYLLGCDSLACDRIAVSLLVVVLELWLVA